MGLENPRPRSSAPGRLGRAAPWARALAALTLGCVAAVAACDTDPSAPARRQHILSRIGYGPDAWSLARIEEIGANAYVEEQLHPETIPDDEFEARLAEFESLDMTYAELSSTYVKDLVMGGMTGANLFPGRELAHAKFLRSVLSRRQLEAVLIDFWFNHLNIFGRGDTLDYDVVVYEREVIRPHVLGRFEDMLIASARSAGMLEYLDNISNTIEDPPQYKYLGNGINENYARELLELHTVSVAAGYTQQDVIEVARVLTGWSLRYGDGSRQFWFRSAIHDTDPKSIMGELELPAGGGLQEGYTLLQFLARHPSTATFLCEKLGRRLLSEHPPESVLNTCERVWGETNGDLREVTGSLLRSVAFLAAPNAGLVRDKVKRPLVFLASLVRALGTDPDPVFESYAATGFLSRTGEALFMAKPPTGYPEDSASWIGPGSLLARIELVEWAVRSLVGFEFVVGVDPLLGDEPLVDGLLDRLHMGDVSDETRDEAIRLASLLTPRVSDPEYRARQIAKFLLTSPDFMRH